MKAAQWRGKRVPIDKTYRDGDRKADVYHREWQGPAGDRWLVTRAVRYERPPGGTFAKVQEDLHHDHANAHREARRWVERRPYPTTPSTWTL